MAMENSPNMENLTGTNGNIYTQGNGSAQISNNVKENEDLDIDFFENLDLYLEYINGRLTISRMVSDSVIRGMVNAVEQEAAEKIDREECEVARLKETLHLYHVGADENDSLGLPLMHNDIYSSFSDALEEHNRIRESLGSLKNAAKEQFKTLRKEVDKIRGLSSMRRINSGSELVGLGGILQENISKNWMDMDITFDSLKKTLDTSFKWMDDMVCLSKASLWQWQREREFQEEIEDMVITNCVRSLKEDFEEKLWDQNARFCGNESLNWLEKIKEMSSLRQELDAINKSFSIPELGQPTSHGSLEIVDEGNNKKIDHLHRKVSGNHVSSCSLRDGNGKHEESVITMPENFDGSQLKHMKKDELLNYFKTEMSKMKRNHDYEMYEMTEELFSLKREYLKERSSSLPLRKDKELDMLRKKIPDVILKLDKILVENEKLPAFSNNAGNLGNLKDKLDSLLSENRQLRDLLIDKKKEVNHLSSLASDAAEKMSQQSLAEANLLEVIGSLECAVEDAQMEASIKEDVYKCLLKELIGQIKFITEESDMEHDIMRGVYEIIFKDIAYKAAPSCKCNFEDTDIESFIMQGLCAVILREALKDAEEKLSGVNMKYMNENEIRVSLEIIVLESERALRLEVAEKERLKQEMLLLESLVEEKEKLLQEAEAALAKGTEQFQLASQELNDLRDQASQQQRMILESRLESEVMKSNLDESRKQIELFVVEIHELKQKLELTTKELRENNDEKRMLLTVTLEKQNTLSMIEAKDSRNRKQMESVIILVNVLVKAVADFEFRVTENIKKNNLRLENLFCQLSSLTQKADVLKRMGLMYKQRFERKRSDLQKAEAEVDLLGDEVDYLLNLLEKIYIALDHYSPILQHYPGIIDILKLVKRELSGGSTN